jgi:5,10-methylene-tetrahydrofolate dehydrogenase/methenyl tetrahydrofolate cyclohydrolase
MTLLEEYNIPLKVWHVFAPLLFSTVSNNMWYSQGKVMCLVGASGTVGVPILLLALRKGERVHVVGVVVPHLERLFVSRYRC